MCSQCEGYREPLSIAYPYQYFDLLRQLREKLRQGRLVLAAASCDLGALAEGQPWPADLLSHTFRCTHCGQGFLLSLDTYHGRGEWGALEQPPA